MEFSEKLTELRKAKGWSQQQLADMLYVTRQTVSEWELGQTAPEIAKLIELSRLFEITIDELVNNIDIKASVEEPKTGFSNKGTYREEDANAVNFNKKYFHYEYKSEKKILGIPLVHINIGSTGFYKAKGIIAIGNIAQGVISVGMISMGLVSLGALSLGVISFGAIVIGLMLAFGGVAVGTVAIGGLAIGIFAVGGCAIGMYSIGGCAIGSRIAAGGYANGHIAIGEKTSGAVQLSKYSTSQEIKSAILKIYPDIWNFIAVIFSSIV